MGGLKAPTCSYIIGGARQLALDNAKAAEQERNNLAPMEAEIRAECQALADMLCEKNAVYGNSVLDPVRIFSDADTAEQIRVRIDDKLSRMWRGNAAGEDVVLDLLGYLIFLRIAMREA